MFGNEATSKIVEDSYPVQTAKCNTETSFVAGAVFLAVLLRILLLSIALHISGLKPIYASDTHGYVATVPALLHGSFATSAGPELQRTPGYPIFLLMTGLSLGHPLWSDFCQILLSGICVYLVFLVGKLTSGNAKAAIIGAYLYAVEPLTLLYSVELLTECLFTTLLLVFLLCMILDQKKPAWKLLLLAALTLVGTVYVRPASYYFPILAAAFLVVFPRQFAWKLRLQRATAFLGICVVLIGAWRVRNFLETGYSGFSSIADTNLYYFNAGEVLAQKQHVSFNDELGLLHWQDREGYLSVHPEQRDWTQAQIFQYQKRTALHVIFDNKFLYAKDHLMGMLVVLLHPCITDYMWFLGQSPLSTVTAIAWNPSNPARWTLLRSILRAHVFVILFSALLSLLLLFYYGFALVGILRCQRRSSVFLLLLLTSFYFILVAGGAAGMARYRYPVLPMVCIFAGCGIFHLRELCRFRQRGPA